MDEVTFSDWDDARRASAELKEWRTREGLSLVSAGERLGVSAPTWYAWELVATVGRSRPADHHREALQSLTGIDRDQWRLRSERELVERVARENATEVAP